MGLSITIFWFLAAIAGYLYSNIKSNKKKENREKERNAGNYSI